MKIIFTKSFEKILLKLNSIKKEDIIKLLEKYPNSDKLETIDHIGTSKVIKGYLYSNKIRILILFEYVKGKFIPVYITKKETPKGRNIRKDNYIELFGNDIDKVISDIDNNNYEEINL